VVEWLTLLLRIREALKPVILTEVSRGLLQSLEANAGTVKLGPRITITRRCIILVTEKRR
jgi:hypothetical protein